MLGRKLRDRYYIFKELGMGGFGQTFLAQDYDFPGQPWCVVKQLKPQVKEPWMLQTARRLFDLEASVLAHIGNHPQIPQLKAHFEEEEQFYLVQEFIEGDLLSKELNTGKVWSQERAIIFLQDILEVLKFIHDNKVIHRDLKPENIIRRKSDQKLVLIDFGSVKKITAIQGDDEEDSELTVVIGTPAYMPIEQQGGKPSYNSDIYALGKIVIQGLSGIAPKRLADDPQTGELLWRHLVNVDDGFADILSRMVKWRARDRYESVQQIIDDLTPYSPQIASLKNQPRSKSSKNYNQLDRVVHNLKKHPEITRIKKLLFCAYQHRWENNSRVLVKYRTKFLIQELSKRESSLDAFQDSINGVVKTLNKKSKYQPVANFITDQVKALYESPVVVTGYENYDVAPSEFTGIRPRENTNEKDSSPAYTELKKSTDSDSLIISKQTEKDPSNYSGASASATSQNQANQNLIAEDHKRNCNLFDLRYEVTRYTTPLRIKILLFSTLYYKIDFNEQDWSLMMSHQLDSLLKELIEIFPSLVELETRLYATAKNFNEKEGLTQTVGAIIQSLRPFYENGQPKLTSLN